MKVRKTAMLYRRGGEIHVLSQSQTPDRFWFVNGTWYRVAGSDPVEIASAVQKALLASEQGVGEPSHDAHPIDAVLTEIGVPSYEKYVADADAVMVEYESTGAGETVYVSPMRRLKSVAGYEPITSGEIELSAPSDVELGNAVEAALGATR